MQKKRPYCVSRSIQVLVSIIVFLIVTGLNYRQSRTHNYLLANIIAGPLALKIATFIRLPKETKQA